MNKKNNRNGIGTFIAKYAECGGRDIPKHLVLRDAMLAAITDGYWEPGSKLPTESELSASVPYSLGTIQRALRSLVEQGVVERRRGSGTYVADQRKQLDSPWHCRFLSEDGKSFLPVFTVVLKREVTQRHGSWSAPLQQGQGRVIEIDRRMEINDEFVVYSKFFVLADRFPEFIDAPMESLMGANLKLLIVRAAGRAITSLKELLRQVELPGYVCRAIGVKKGSTGIMVQATAYGSNNTSLYYQELYIPPNNRSLYMESKVPPVGLA
jgi:GntR family transcriptional regulator